MHPHGAGTADSSISHRPPHSTCNSSAAGSQTMLSVDGSQRRNAERACCARPDHSPVTRRGDLSRLLGVITVPDAEAGQAALWPQRRFTPSTRLVTTTRAEAWASRTPPHHRSQACRTVAVASHPQSPSNVSAKLRTSPTRRLFSWGLRNAAWIAFSDSCTISRRSKSSAACADRKLAVR